MILRNLLILSVFLFSSFGQASRVPEVESYLMDKVSSLLRNRFPDKPFTVWVKVDTGKKDSDRKGWKEEKKDSARLPYLDFEDSGEVEIDFWDRTDIPIETMIGHLEKISIRITVDSSLLDEELKELQEAIAAQLKLVPGSDIIEITKKDWINKEVNESRRMIALGAFALMLLLFGCLYWLSRLSVKQLVSGITKPISEIGESTKEFASSALDSAAGITSSGSTSEEDDADERRKGKSLNANLLQIRKNALELLERNRDILLKPDAEVMSFFERHGEDEPGQVGAILTEVDEEVLKTLFKYGKGSWWYVALAQPMPIDEVGLGILSELDRLRIRRHFSKSKQNESKEVAEVGLVFARLTMDEVQEVFSGISIEKAEGILNILPRTKALAIAKKLFPGQWAVFLDTSKKLKPIDMDLLKKLETKALETAPLREEFEIEAFFRDLDLVRFLDSANTRDEKEFYMVLPKDSRIRSDRTAYFTVFEAPKEVIKLMGPTVDIRDWAYALSAAEPSERDFVYNNLNDRQSFLVKEEVKSLMQSELDPARVRIAKRRVLKAFIRNTNLHAAQVNSKDESDQAA